MKLTVKAHWDKQTKRWQRYVIEGTQAVGQIYIPTGHLPSAASANFPNSIEVSIEVPISEKDKE